jgi:uncharacterized membrane protein (UPF0127 family)
MSQAAENPVEAADTSLDGSATAASNRRSSHLQEIVLISPSGRVVCDRCYVANGTLSRARGLIGWSELAPGEGMLLRPSWAMHTALVRFPVDVVFFDESLRVLAIKHSLKPWRAAWKRRAHRVLELPAGRCKEVDLKPGDTLAWGSV